MCQSTILELLRDDRSKADQLSSEIPSCVPSDRLSQAAYEHVRQQLHSVILAHSFRVFLYAVILSQREGHDWHNNTKLPLLFTAAMFHDFGTADSCNGPERFEVEGADAAAAFLKSHAVPEAEVREVWIAIACHTSAGIGERISTLARLIRFGPLVDFKRPDIRSRVDDELLRRVEEAFPRGEPDKILSDIVVEQALQQPSKAPPATWPGVITRFKRENPDWTGVNKEF